MYGECMEVSQGCMEEPGVYGGEPECMEGV